VARLEELARAGKLRGLPGIQAKTEQNILKGIEVIRKGQERMPLGHALPLAQELVATLGKLPEVEQIEVAGSLRRGPRLLHRIEAAQHQDPRDGDEEGAQDLGVRGLQGGERSPDRRRHRGGGLRDGRAAVDSAGAARGRG
jgi:hypothetical protein